MTPTSARSPDAIGPPHATASDALDVGEQIRQLQALVELRGAGILTDGELPALKRRVLLSGSHAPHGARHAPVTQAGAVGGALER